MPWLAVASWNRAFVQSLPGVPRFKPWLVPELKAWKSREPLNSADLVNLNEFGPRKLDGTSSKRDTSWNTDPPIRSRIRSICPRIFYSCFSMFTRSAFMFSQHDSKFVVLFTSRCLLSEVISSLLAGLFWRSFLELGLSEACSVENPTSSRFLQTFVTPNGP